ncbi:hypothetical protein [Polyangium spumosum]|uniref:Uncharacterized protein n=1 Tax=Polyangium spumosum TaxID=889282 RepID=A0A6N7Q5X1_9BACT|nr:hypothetical protein [Polyangium spumosum]MRG98290.1 hypothetical protein [Polyangium spumosum]
MLAGEFGYMVVRTDVSPVVRVEVRRVGRAFEAELWGPDTEGGVEAWHGKTDTQGTCRELAYDIAALVRARLGPGAWGREDPPAHLAAPPEIEVQRPELRPFALRLPESLAFLAPRMPASLESSTPNAEGSPVLIEAGLGAAVSPYGLPSVAVGGNAFLGVRWRRFAAFVEARGLITPASGIGETEIPGRATIWTGSAMPCLALKYVDGCAVVSLSQLQIDLGHGRAVTGSDGFSVGFGGRVNGKLSLSERFSLLGYADFNMQLRSIALELAPQTSTSGAVPDWRSPLLRITLGVAVTASFSD